MKRQEIEKRIGENLKHLRETKDFTQEMLSAKLQILGCDITRSALAKVEVGQRHLYLDEIVYLKQILDIKYDDLFDIVEGPKKPAELEQEKQQEEENIENNEEKQP